MNIIKNERNKIIAVIAFTICLITNSCTTTITKGDDSPLVIQKVFMNMNGLYNGRMDKTKLAYPYYLFFKCKIVNNTADTLLWRALKFSSDFEGSYEIDNESPLYAEVYCHLKMVIPLNYIPNMDIRFVIVFSTFFLKIHLIHAFLLTGM